MHLHLYASWLLCRASSIRYLHLIEDVSILYKILTHVAPVCQRSRDVVNILFHFLQLLCLSTIRFIKSPHIIIYFMSSINLDNINRCIHIFYMFYFSEIATTSLSFVARSGLTPRISCFMPALTEGNQA